jgi:hypothetical protein
MSGYGTKKPGGTFAAQLTFPTVFQNTYAELGATPRFAPTPAQREMNVSQGKDFQSSWHEQKKLDAHRMATAKVQSTHNADVRAHTAVHNMPNQPKPVLGQRKYANPSMGAVSGSSARQDVANGPFHYSDSISGGHDYETPPEYGGRPSANGSLVGGVLRTAVGQSYGNRILQNRIAQLNAINQAKMVFDAQGQTPFQESMPFAGEQPSRGLELLPQVELANLLQSINDNLSNNFHASPTGEEAGSRFTYQDSTKAFQLIVRLASTGSAEEIDNVLEFINGTSADDGIITKLEALTIRPTRASDTLRGAQVLLSLKDFWERIKMYLEKMAKLVGQPAKDRANASKALIKSLKFSQLRSTVRPDDMINVQDAQQAVDDQSGSFQSGGNWRDGFRGNPSTPDSSDAPSWYPRGGPAFSDSTASTASSGSTAPSRRPLLRREDAQHGYIDAGAEFSQDERNTFAYNSGEIDTGGRPIGWSGPAEQEEGAVEYGEVPQEAPEAEEGEEEGAEAESSSGEEASPGIQSRRNEFGDWDLGMRSPEPFVPSPPSVRAEAPSTQKKSQPFITRDRLPTTLDGYRQLAKQVNSHYNNRLPDGKGPIAVGVGKVTSVRQNFIRRLGL